MFRVVWPAVRVVFVDDFDWDSSVFVSSHVVKRLIKSMIWENRSSDDISFDRDY